MLVFFFKSPKLLELSIKPQNILYFMSFLLSIKGSQQGHYQEWFSKVTKKTF